MWNLKEKSMLAIAIALVAINTSIQVVMMGILVSAIGSIA